MLDLNFDGVRVEGILEYDKTLFDPAVCERLAKQFVAVCEQMVEHPDQVVERIDLGGPHYILCNDGFAGTVADRAI
ncbi:MAG: hypothetical protein R3C56_27820 [Pirellulaceae bacterium]